MVGFGFAVPFLRPYLADAKRVVALMPAPQGVIGWPQGMPNVSVLCEETLWPMETGHVDKLLVVHGLETSERPGALLEECWRVLGPGGSALFIVPNRAGLWSRSDRTPFGYGRPYSQGQLETQLKTHNFLPERHATASSSRPRKSRFWRKTAGMWERLGGSLGDRGGRRADGAGHEARPCPTARACARRCASRWTCSSPSPRPSRCEGRPGSRARDASRPFARFRRVSRRDGNFSAKPRVFIAQKTRIRPRSFSRNRQIAHAI